MASRRLDWINLITLIVYVCGVLTLVFFPWWVGSRNVVVPFLPQWVFIQWFIGVLVLSMVYLAAWMLVLVLSGLARGAVWLYEWLFPYRRQVQKLL